MSRFSWQLAALGAAAFLSVPAATLVHAAPVAEVACDERGNPVAGGRYGCIDWQTAPDSVAPGQEVTLSYDCGGAYAVVDHSVNGHGAPFTVVSHNWDDGQSVPSATVRNAGSSEGTVSLSGRCVTRQPA